LSADEDFWNFFFWGDWGWCHYMDCLFLSHSKWWTQASSTVTILQNIPSTLSVLSSTRRLQGIHLVHTFKYPRSGMI
jgi:hypothetical protein